MTTCLNCSSEFTGNFCNQCGQKASTHRFTLHEWLHEIPHSIFHIDNGFFYTLKNLCLRPGNFIRDYLDGKRKPSFSPFLYVLIWCGVFVVISHLFAGDAEHAVAITDFKSANEYLETNYYKALVVAMILPTALASYLVFIKSGYNFAENLVLNSFVTAQLIIADIILHLIAVTPLREVFSGKAAILNLLLKFPFWIWAYWQFFKPKNIIVGVLQVLAAVVLGSVFASIMVEGFAYLLYMFKAGSH